MIQNSRKVFIVFDVYHCVVFMLTGCSGHNGPLLPAALPEGTSSWCLLPSLQEACPRHRHAGQYSTFILLYCTPFFLMPLLLLSPFHLLSISVSSIIHLSHYVSTLNPQLLRVMLSRFTAITQTKKTYLYWWCVAFASHLRLEYTYCIYWIHTYCTYLSCLL